MQTDRQTKTGAQRKRNGQLHTDGHTLKDRRNSSSSSLDKDRQKTQRGRH